MTSDPPLYGTEAFQNAAGDCWRPGGLELTRYGLELCAFPEGARLLDLGCGAGATLVMLRERGFDAVGLDREKRCPDGLPFVEGNAAEPPFPDEDFDGLICECVLSLLPDKEAALREFFRLLRPGGRLLLTDLYLRDSTPFAPAEPGTSSSCADGALPRTMLEKALTQAGLTLLSFEDHSAALKALAARLLWYGAALPEQFCSSRRLGYGLWLAERSHLPNS